MASVQVVQNQGDPADTSLDTQLKEQDEIKNLLICDSSLHLNHTGIFLGMMSMGGNQVFKDLPFMKRTCKLCTFKRIM